MYGLLFDPPITFSTSFLKTPTGAQLLQWMSWLLQVLSIFSKVFPSRKGAHRNVGHLLTSSYSTTCLNELLIAKSCKEA